MEDLAELCVGLAWDDTAMAVPESMSCADSDGGGSRSDDSAASDGSRSDDSAASDGGGSRSDDSAASDGSRSDDSAGSLASSSRRLASSSRWLAAHPIPPSIPLTTNAKFEAF